MLVNPAEVRHAIESDSIAPCFQPVVDLRTLHLTGFEVLTRWYHPTLGPILPKNFIHVAEEIGIIGILTRQILRSAFRSAATLPERLSLAINVSPIQFRSNGLALKVVGALGKSGLAPNRLELEITESVLLQNSEDTLTLLHQLKNMAVGGYDR